MLEKFKKILSVKEKEGWGSVIRRIFRKVCRFPIIYKILVYYKNYRAFRALTSPIKLHLGCGRVRLEEYVNIDIEDWAGTCDIVCSATELAIFADNSVNHIFNHSLLEHIPPWDTIRTLKEWYRVLKPGGTIRIETIDLERIFEFWLIKGKLSEQREKSPINPIKHRII